MDGRRKGGPRCDSSEMGRWLQSEVSRNRCAGTVYSSAARVAPSL